MQRVPEILTEAEQEITVCEEDGGSEWQEQVVGSRRTSHDVAGLCAVEEILRVNARPVGYKDHTE